jgi:dihydroxyacetone kinase-like protein
VRELAARDLIGIIKKLAQVFEENRNRLNELDAKIGDGDHGLSMARGFSAVASFLGETAPGSISDILMQGGMRFNEVSGSTIGILMFSAMREMGKAVAGKEKIGLLDLTAMLAAAIQGIEKRGKAAVGQKTILDSLQPALDALRRGLTVNESEDALLRAAAIAASEGAESTRIMESKIGRAKWFAERSRGELDPGAVSGSLIMNTVVEYLTGA